MKTFKDILMILTEKKKKKTFTLDQINAALLKAGIGPTIIVKAMTALNVLRGMGIVESKDENL